MMQFIETHMDYDKNYKPSDEEDKDDGKDVKKTLETRLLKINYMVFMQFRSIS